MQKPHGRNEADTLRAPMGAIGKNVHLFHGMDYFHAGILPEVDTAHGKKTPLRAWTT
jgi:hypothetical protein